MSNTLQRVLSALILVSIVLFCMYMGVNWLLGLVFIIGLIMVDELYLNFLKKKRNDKGYIVALSFFSFFYLYLNFVQHLEMVFNIAVCIGLSLDIILTVFLFKYIGSPEKRFVKFLNTFSIWIGFYVLILLLCLTMPIYHSGGMKWIGLILLVNFSADTCAWFFGKNFGKHKLMPTGSPKKTREGALGGVLCSVILGSIYWSFLMGELNSLIIFSLVLIAVFSVIGDLVQSKLKRLFKIKDSSSLIPGHGGVYDRLDSLLFVMPLYIFLLVPKG